MRVILNIGLNAPTVTKPRTEPGYSTGFRRLSRSMAEAIEAFGPCYFELAGRKHGQEPTLVVACNTKHKTIDGVHAAIDVLSSVLNQDRIAFVVDGTGYLSGPAAVEWGEFNNAFFFYPRGECTVSGHHPIHRGLQSHCRPCGGA